MGVTLFPANPNLTYNIHMSSTRIARHLRGTMTEAEHRLWRHLRLRQMDGIKIRRQQPIGPYVADFACLERRLVIELDGGHHADQCNADEARTKWLEDQGFTVIRYWNNQVMTDVDGVLMAIRNVLAALPHRSRSG